MSEDSDLYSATAKQICFKPGIFTNACISIIEQILAGHLWGDEIKVETSSDDRNVIGTAFKILMRAGLVERTGAHRRSTVKEQKGRVCWEYRLPSVALARTFLRRNGRVQVDPQIHLGL